MTPGTVLFDKEFKFQDGGESPKLLVILNDGTGGFYIFVKATSQRHNKGLSPGCQPKDRFRNFYLPKGSCLFSKATWIQLDEFYEADVNKLFELKMKGQLIYEGCLEEVTVKELLVCSIGSADIAANHERVLEDVLATLVLK